ncbi:hypothetical protein GH714_038294 [Hevea brasiliensis]|uniref:Dehydrogenase E1 component domain-containing protein n=1 Tax=Hevea brasiliensis TaxID=3981 RepID=A0A6A6MN87_HEVBR|nr:hypothetical protein GH714_038294 [Hevea brasiliensis]
MCAQMYYRGKMFGFVHLYNGQEAVSTGFIKLLKKEDYVVSTYRDHVHALSKGVPARAVMSELFGKTTGCCRGQGGSMHMFSKEHNVLGGFAFIGEGIPVATGAAFTSKYKRRSRDWKKGPAFGMPGVHVDGMDVLKVREVAKEAIGRARMGGGPTLVECETYRFRGHSLADPDELRDPAEKAHYAARDPITFLKKYIIENELASEAELKAIEKKKMVLRMLLNLQMRVLFHLAASYLKMSLQIQKALELDLMGGIDARTPNSPRALLMSRFVRVGDIH